jgi:hyaluronan synthase
VDGDIRIRHPDSDRDAWDVESVAPPTGQFFYHSAVTLCIPDIPQVRWARATHIETFQQPKVYLLNHPIFFWAAFKREAGPLLVLASIIIYLLTGARFVYFSWLDIGCRLAYTTLYNWLRNPDRGPRLAWLWITPALLFYNIPLPIIQLWSLVTIFEHGWGTSMRSNAELSKHHQFWKRWYDVGFFVVWMGIVGATAARLLGSIAGWDDGTTFLAMLAGLVIPSSVSFYALIFDA